MSALIPLFEAKHAAKLSGLFDCVDVAEREITSAMETHPAHKLALWNSFRLLLPRYGMATMHPQMYVAHCRELLARVVAGDDTRPGTVAECLILSSQASAVIPLKGVGMSLHGRLFASVFGDDVLHQTIGQRADQLYEEYPTQIDDLIADLRNQARDDTRVLKALADFIVPAWLEDDGPTGRPSAARGEQLGLFDEAVAL